MTNDGSMHEAFGALSSEEKIDFLIRLGHELTIVARSAYDTGTEKVTHPQWLRGINELQHRVFGFLLPLMRHDTNRYPDDVLVKILLEGWGDAELGRVVLQVFERYLPATVPANAPTH